MGSFPETYYDPFVVAHYFLALVIQANIKYFLSNTYQLKVEIFLFLGSVLPKCSGESVVFRSITTYEKRKYVTSSWWHCLKMPFPNVPSIIASARNITSSEKCLTCMFWSWLGMPNLSYIFGL